MAKDSIPDFSATSSSNTDIQSVNIDEGCPASNLNNAIRELMVDLKNVDTGAVALTSPSASQLNVDNLRLDGNTISSTDTNGNITLDPNGTGVTAITGGFTASDGCTITTADNDPQLTLVSTDADATQGPVLKFYRNSASPADNDLIGQLLFHGEDGAGNDQQYANIQSIIMNNAQGNEDGRLTFRTLKAGTATSRLDITNAETVFNDSSIDVDFRVESDANTHMLFVDAGNNKVRLNTTANQVTSYEIFSCNGGAGFKNGDASVVGVWQTQSDAFAMQFFSGSGGTNVGSISVTASATAFNTSSDYRLKENVTAITNATDRLKQLNPVRFNFIADADTTVDGFLAHEVSDIVPEAISGEKDAMKDEQYEVTPAVLDDDGNEVTPAEMGTRSVPDYQGIDQSKLVPLLVATIQELEARIAALEA